MPSPPTIQSHKYRTRALAALRFHSITGGRTRARERDTTTARRGPQTWNFDVKKLVISSDTGYLEALDKCLNLQ